MIRELAASLSASEADTWEDICISLAIVSGFLLTIGLIGEFPDGANWKKHWLYPVAKIAVVVGVAGELLGDAGIFATSGRLQELTNISIRDSVNVAKAMLDQLKPRDITKEQLATIASALRGHIGTVYLYPLSDPEASQYVYAIAETIKAAGGNPRLVLSGQPGALVFPDKFDVSVSSTGVTAYESGESGGKREIIDLLMDAFGKAGIEIIGQYSGKLGGIIDGKRVDDAEVLSPAIFVGLKPLPFSRFPAYDTPPELEKFLKEHPPAWEPK